tara:strand:- start:1124 stop:1570 length:447 start_codon:yes stop_codon:yes gene_type:complete
MLDKLHWAVRRFSLTRHHCPCASAKVTQSTHLGKLMPLLRLIRLPMGRIRWQRSGKAFLPVTRGKQYMANREDIMAKICELIGPFNNKGVDLTASTTFQGDLEWDSLTVMDFVAAVEDEFDIIITMNMQAEIETVGQLADAVAKLMDS